MKPGYLGPSILALLTGLLVILPACTPAAPTERTRVVTTNNIVADWVKQIGGDRVEVFSLLPPGTDPHMFQPGAADVARVAGADLIFTVGLGLEGAWLSRLLENAAADPARVVAVGESVDALPGEKEDEHEGEEDEEEHSLFDAHFWWDALRVKRAVDAIARHLTEADPAGASVFARNQADYRLELDRLDSRTIERLRQIPPERRKLVTSHETMNYYASRYGFEAVGAVIPGVTTEREPSAAELAKLAVTIRQLGVAVIFSETTVSDRLARTIASESGARIVRLYSDSLGPPGSIADTYIKMMDYNAQTIAQALR